MAYTAKQLWNAALTETQKSGAPSLLLEDYNYFINKAINLYINKHYTAYDINLLTTDDLRVLKATAMLKVRNVNYKPQFTNLEENLVVHDMNILGAGLSKLFSGTYEITLPPDYLHMLNCVCIFKMLSDYKCYDKDNNVLFKATRLTADSWSNIINDYYQRPLPWRPYYYIHNVNQLDTVATNPRDSELNPTGTDYAVPFKTDYENLTHVPSYGETTNKKTNVLGTKPESDEKNKIIETNETDKTPVQPSMKPINITEEQQETNPSEQATLKNPGFNRTVTIRNINNELNTVDVVDVKPAGLRLGNPNGVRCEIRCGNDDSVFKLQYVFVDYIKAPQQVRLTQEQIDLIKDTSLIMEFPDYVCQEIINELIMLIMENLGNLRLATQPQVSQSINYQNAAPQVPQQQLVQQRAER